jgi:hypothetical protein
MPKSAASTRPPASTKSAAVAPTPDASDTPEPLTPPELLLQRADTLFRTAVETCRQHRRYAALVERSARDGEQRSAFKLASFCDTLLVDAIASYEKCGARVQGLDAEAWWHKANALWHHAREYERRHEVTARASRMLNAQHDPQMLGELALEYDLEASALLFLQQAIEGYRKVRPEAEIKC